MKPEDTKEEYKQVEEQLSTNETRETVLCAHIRSFLRGILSPIFVEVFVMTFLAEWGDRSQITTIVLAAREVSSWTLVGLTFLPIILWEGKALYLYRYISRAKHNPLCTILTLGTS